MKLFQSDEALIWNIPNKESDGEPSLVPPRLALNSPLRNSGRRRCPAPSRFASPLRLIIVARCEGLGVIYASVLVLAPRDPTRAVKGPKAPNLPPYFSWIWTQEISWRRLAVCIFRWSRQRLGWLSSGPTFLFLFLLFCLCHSFYPFT